MTLCLLTLRLLIIEMIDKNVLFTLLSVHPLKRSFVFSFHGPVCDCLLSLPVAMLLSSSSSSSSQSLWNTSQLDLLYLFYSFVQLLSPLFLFVHRDAWWKVLFIKQLLPSKQVHFAHSSTDECLSNVCFLWLVYLCSLLALLFSFLSLSPSTTIQSHALSLFLWFMFTAKR